MKTIQKVLKTTPFNYQLVKIATETNTSNNFAVIAPDGEIIEEGLNLSDGLETLYFIDPPKPH